METQYTWTTRLFSRTFEIFRNEMSVGSMTKQVWSGKSTGRLNSREIMFVTKGFFRHETQIIDVQMEAFLGSILYNIWKGKSSVRLNNKEYNLHI